MVSAFEEACKKLSNGSLSDVVSTQFGFHLIKLTGRKE
jgi:peptidyl-prolyl cis-trans isomerase C